MKVRPQLVPVRVPEDPVCAVLVLHGGASRRDDAPVSPTQLSVLRMIPVARRIAENKDLAVFRLLNSHRGWDTRHAPVDDAHAALAELSERLGQPLPTSLVGHSLGARAALLAGNHPDVVSIVALNAYLHSSDTRLQLEGRRVAFIHGDRDRVADPLLAHAVAVGVARSSRVDFVRVRGGKHSMLTRHRAFEGSTARFVAENMLPQEPRVGLAEHTV